MLRDVYLAFMRLHVLYHAVEAPFYGMAMMEELRRHGYEIGAGTFYPLLHKMEADDLLRCEQRVVEGRARKYYTATAEGRRALDEARERLEELVEEVLEGHGPGALLDPSGGDEAEEEGT